MTSLHTHTSNHLDQAKEILDTQQMELLHQYNKDVEGAIKEFDGLPEKYLKNHLSKLKSIYLDNGLNVDEVLNHLQSRFVEIMK